jgi:hypothetical protein
MIDFYAPDGTVIDLHEWCRLFEERSKDMSSDSWWRRQTWVSTTQVSTVWVGVDYSFGYGGQPLMWETMIFGDDDLEDDCYRYPSRQKALDHHEEIVRRLKARTRETS